MISELFTPQPYGPFHYMTTKLNIVLIIVSWVAFALRLWVRQKYLKSYSTDDWLMLVALILFTSYAAVVIVFMYILNSGRVLFEMQRFTNSYAGGVALSFWSNISLKLSLCYFFLRFLNQRYARYTIIGATILSTVSNITGCLVFLITCGGPSQAVQFLFVGTCASKPYMDSRAFVRAGIYFPTYTNIAVDVIFSLIPIPMLLQTTLDRKQKVTVGVYLALSTIGSVCAIGKLFYTYRSLVTFDSYIGIARGYSSFNTGELAAYIIGGCVAAYRPMLMAIGRRINTTMLSRPNATNGSSFLERSSRNRQSAIGGGSRGGASSGHFTPQMSSATYDVERGLSEAASPISGTSTLTSHKGRRGGANADTDAALDGMTLYSSPANKPEAEFNFAATDMDGPMRTAEGSMDKESGSVLESNDAHSVMEPRHTKAEES